MSKSTKTSLFKQRIKGVRSQNPPEQSSFPKPVKIEIEEKQPQMKNQNSGHNFVKGLLTSTLSEKEVNEINEENMKKIQQMSQEEIESYQKMIFKDLPKNFLNKVAKNKPAIEEIKPPKQEVMEEEQMEAVLGCLGALAIDVKKWEVVLMLPNMQSEQIVGCENLKLMLGSENNQTKIIGCKILVNLCQGIVKHRVCKDLDLVKICGVPFHLKMLVEDICRNLLSALMMSMKKTSFRSCWVEMLACLTESVDVLIDLLEAEFLEKKLLPFLKEQKAKKAFNYKQKEVQQEKSAHFLTEKSIDIVIEKIQSNLVEEKSVQFLDLFNKREEIMLELVLLEEVENGYNFPKILDSLARELEEMDYKEGVRICYNLCKELKKIQTRRKNIIDIFKQKIFITWKSQILFCLSKIKKYSPLQILHILFSLKTLNNQVFIQFIHEISESASDQIINVITFLTIDEYKEKPCSPQQISNIEQMLQFLSFHLAKHEPSLLFSSLLSVFQQNQQSYSSINEGLLNECFRSIALGSEVWQLISDQRAKELVRRYNYNSFGNYCFTRVMLYLLVTCEDRNLQCLLIEEMVQRYPFLFYYAAESEVYGDERLYRYSGENEQEKQATYKMIEVNQKLNNANSFVKWTRKI